MHSRSASMLSRYDQASSFAVFPTELGWMALTARDNTLQRLTFGHENAIAAAADVDIPNIDVDQASRQFVAKLSKRLQAYASGAYDDFLDVELDGSHLSPFAIGVIEAARRIPIGETRTYGQLAAAVGRPRAARAVGRVMSQNRTPLVMPCHRVVGNGGKLCGFSAVDGLRMKKRLLQLEAELVGVAT